MSQRDMKSVVRQLTALVKEAAALTVEEQPEDFPTHCNYCHGVGACPLCWGRAAIEAQKEQHARVLSDIAKQCDTWASESSAGGWSTHQVKPNRQFADRIRRLRETGEW